ncbi:hypothetical protein CIHG_09700 [Coccidioides immitis H538.4]|uniref:Uncharacterized protein n=1 Tax=Coccidioides immitis H538.4 TaxID=396776 RepID=A0A0J8S6D2_COCIT|nr:hypothetical protein CIHG_09700 [Coccidioides immitis H538.4]
MSGKKRWVKRAEVDEYMRTRDDKERREVQQTDARNRLLGRVGGRELKGHGGCKNRRRVSSSLRNYQLRHSRDGDTLDTSFRTGHSGCKSYDTQPRLVIISRREIRGLERDVIRSKTGKRWATLIHGDAHSKVHVISHSSLSSLGKICWVRLEEEHVRFTIIPDQGTQETIFDSYSFSAAAGVINLEVPIAALHRALKSATDAASATLRLTKKDLSPFLL